MREREREISLIRLVDTRCIVITPSIDEVLSRRENEFGNVGLWWILICGRWVALGVYWYILWCIQFVRRCKARFSVVFWGDCFFFFVSVCHFGDGRYCDQPLRGVGRLICGVCLIGEILKIMSAFMLVSIEEERHIYLMCLSYLDAVLERRVIFTHDVETARRH